MSQLVAQRTGLAPQDAEKRVNDAFTRAKTTLEQGKVKAKAAADAARKSASYGSLWLFISLVVGAMFASYCANVGGRQRDL